MRNLWIAWLLLSSYTISAQTGEKNFIDQNYIEVTGKAEMEIVPDLIYLRVVLNEKDSKNKISIAELEQRMTKKLAEIGIDIEKDVLIKDLSSNFRYYLIAKSDILLSKEFQILVRNGKTAGQVFIQLEKIGISNISVEKLDNSHMEDFRKEVKISAIKAAKEKAQALSEAIDQSAGRALYIKEIENRTRLNTGAASNIMIRGSSKMYGATASAALDIDFEKIILEYSIMCRFELK